MCCKKILLYMYFVLSIIIINHYYYYFLKPCIEIFLHSFLTIKQLLTIKLFDIFSDSIEDDQRRSLLVTLQRLAHATDILAFPLPQGFSSFITYLGYRVMSTSMFSQYVRCNVFSLNVDVMKTILAGKQFKLNC